MHTEPHKFYGSVSHQTLVDSGLAKILSKDVCTCLTSLASKEDIKERQILFEKLNHESFYHTFQALIDAITAFERSEKSLSEAETDCEGYFLFAEHFRIYEELIHTVLAIPCEDSTLLQRLHGYAISAEEKIKDMANDLADYKALLCGISFSKIRISKHSAVLVKGAQTKTASFAEKLIECKKSMGYPDTKTKTSSIRMSLAVSEPMRLLYEEEFQRLSKMKGDLEKVIDRAFLSLKEELCFYFEIAELQQKAKSHGIPCSFPEIAEKRQYLAHDLYDITLLAKMSEGKTIVPNDVKFCETESCFFLTGANGGGKTTYLRALLGNLILFLGGCPIFAESASIFPFTSVFSHFPADEHFENLGRLDEEAYRIAAITEKASSDSFIFLNETFTGADFQKGLRLSLETMEKFHKKKAFCLFITHFHEVSESTFPILTATVNVKNDNARTFKICRGNGHIKKSYAMDILKRYGLDKESLFGKGDVS